MSKKQEESEGMGAGGVVFFLAVLVWLVVTYPWLLLFPVAFLVLLHPSQPPGESPSSASPADRHSRAGAEDYGRHASPEDNEARNTPEGHPPQVKVAPPDFIPKDREYNEGLARTWDEEFEALAKKREQFPPS